MSLKQQLISEIKREFSNTRKMLERIPADKFDWKPHEKSMSLKALSEHLADLASFPNLMVTTDYLDFMEKKPESAPIQTTEDLVNRFNKGFEDSIAELEKVSDSDLEKHWVMRAGDHIIMDLPRKDTIRTMALNHAYHHRAQLGVYLRLLDVSVPGMYGPSADDK